MRPITVWLFGSLGALSIVAPTPSHAAIIRQSFELTVTGFGFRSGDNPDPASINLPPIGTQGGGSYIYDEANLNYINSPSYPVGYYLGRPGKIAFSDFSINFFNHTYTEQISLNSRIGEIFLFDRTPSGQHTPRTLILDTSDGATIVGIVGSIFSYTPAPSTVNGIIGSAIGTLRYTDAEPIPEPPASELSTVFALGVGWFYHRKRATQRNS